MFHVGLFGIQLSIFLSRTQFNRTAGLCSHCMRIAGHVHICVYLSAFWGVFRVDLGCHGNAGCSVELRCCPPDNVLLQDT